MTNPDIAAVFGQIADLLEFQGSNPFRIRAYRNAARMIRDLPESLAEIVADPDRKLTELEGIGKDLAEKITSLVSSGSLAMLEELLTEIPETVLAILRIPGLGPKRAAVLYNELGIATLDELREACNAQKVRDLKGFGAKTEATILAGIDLAAQAAERMLWAEADLHVQAILAHLRQCPAVEQLQVAGSYRRGKETVGDLDFLAVAKDSAEVMDRLASYTDLNTVLLRGETKMSIRLADALQVDLRVVPAESFGAALQYFTGSQAHNIILRSRAKDHGLKINEYGVFRGKKAVGGRTEEEVYAALDLPCIPPELREARREFQWADAGELPELVEPSDIRGDLHVHSTWTDGMATIEAMALAARGRGLKYLAITDHSKRVAMVNGMDARRTRQQWEQIDKINERVERITVLKGIEVDILEKGGLDLPDDLLAEADWVVASIHYGQNQSREQITDRVIEALQNPHVAALAHPTGRLISRRAAYEIDMEAVMRTAAEYGKMLELNAHPMRLDLDDVACAAAKNHGIPIVISTDAHRVDGLECMRYGVQQARRGGLTKEDVANTRTWNQMKKMIGKKK